MAHFAQIDDNGSVLRVLVVDNEQEHRGQEFLSNDLGLGGTWIQTSYSGKIRKNFAGIGMFYDKRLDAFIPIKPFPSWILDENTCTWLPPITQPIEGIGWYWDEETLSWKQRGF